MFPVGRAAILRVLLKPRFGKEKSSFRTNTGISNSRVIISDDDKDLYSVDGIICLRSVFNEEWVTKIQRGIQKARENPSKMARVIPSEDRQGCYFLDYNNCNRISEFRDFIFNSPAAELTGTLMKSKRSVFYYDNIFSKDPMTSRPTPWHQDQTYYPLEGFQTCSIWMPTTPVSKDTCIKFIKGSHRWGHWYWPKQFSNICKDYQNTNAELSKRYQAIPGNIEENTEVEMLSWDIQPGDCLVFHMMIVHGFPNSLDQEGRAVLSTRWVGENVSFGVRPWDVETTLMKGNSKPGDFVYQNERDYPSIWYSS